MLLDPEAERQATSFEPTIGLQTAHRVSVQTAAIGLLQRVGPLSVGDPQDGPMSLGGHRRASNRRAVLLADEYQCRLGKRRIRFDSPQEI